MCAEAYCAAPDGLTACVRTVSRRRARRGRKIKGKNKTKGRKKKKKRKAKEDHRTFITHTGTSSHSLNALVIALDLVIESVFERARGQYFGIERR